MQMMYIDISCSPRSTVVVFMHALFTAGGRSWCCAGVILTPHSCRRRDLGPAVHIHVTTNTTQHNPAHDYDHSDLLTDRRAMDVPANLPNPL